MKKIWYIFMISICFIISISFFSNKIEAKTVTLDNTQYNVNVSNEYQSNNQVEWILITSDRTEGSRVSVEMDIKYIKECSNSTGLVNYSVLKAWINKLEEVYDYFCELNLDPIDSDIVIEWTGVTKQYASAYVMSGNNRIIMNKVYHEGTLRRLQQASEKGIIDINGTVLHEMGHKFSGSYFGSNDSSKGYWNVGTEYINLIMVKYVLDKLVQKNDNIICTVYEYYNYLVGSSKISETGYDDLVNGNIRHIEVYDHYYKSWENIKLKSGYENTGDPTYVDVLYNFSKIFDTIGLDAMKETFNAYFTEEINNYNTTTVFDKFITLMELAKNHSSEEDWSKISENYEWLYNKFIVKITANNITVVEKGESYTSDYKVSYYSNEHEQLTPTFSSRNSNIAIVDNNGNVFGKNSGTTYIRIKAGNECIVVKVTVLPEGSEIKINNISCSSRFFVIPDTNQTITITPIIEPSNATNKTLTWSSDDESIATVDQNGVVTSKGVGLCGITVRATDGSNKKATVNVVVHKKAESITLNYTNYEFKNSTSLQLVATVLPENATNKEVTWETTAPGKLSVDSTGKVIPTTNQGGGMIIARAKDGSGKVATCYITINIPNKYISLNKSECTLNGIGESTNLTATISPSSMSQEVNWTSSNTNVATVDNTGKVTSVGVGTCVITATSKGDSSLKASCNVTVEEVKVTSITLNKTSYTFTDRTPLQLVATILPENATNKEVTWETTTPGILSVDSTGKVTPKANQGGGMIIARAKDGSGKVATCNITINIGGSTTYKKGDINKDGRITVNDLNYGLRGLTRNTLTEEEKQLGDVNGDSRFTVNDLNKLLRYLVGKIKTLD